MKGEPKMSAFVVSEDHIKAIVAFYANGRYFTAISKEEEATRMANILMEQNVRSVNRRYEENQPAERIEITTRDITCKLINDPVAILKLVQSLEYQSCETDDWRETEAKSILDTIQSDAISRLPGYEHAPWTYSKNVHGAIPRGLYSTEGDHARRAQQKAYGR